MSESQKIIRWIEQMQTMINNRPYCDDGDVMGAIYPHERSIEHALNELKTEMEEIENEHDNQED